MTADLWICDVISLWNIVGTIDSYQFEVATIDDKVPDSKPIVAISKKAEHMQCFHIYIYFILQLTNCQLSGISLYCVK